MEGRRRQVEGGGAQERPFSQEDSADSAGDSSLHTPRKKEL